VHLGNKGGETTDRVDDRSRHGIESRIGGPEPHAVEEQANAKEAKGDTGNDLGKEPDFFLDGGEFEFGFSRHLDEAAHDCAVAGGEYDTVTGALSDECGCECEVARFERVVGGRIERSWNHIAAWTGVEQAKHGSDGRAHTFHQ